MGNRAPKTVEGLLEQVWRGRKGIFKQERRSGRDISSTQPSGWAAWWLQVRPGQRPVLTGSERGWAGPARD